MNEHEDLVVREDRARLGNLHKEADKLARQNKLFVRDRLALLFDAGTFVEDGGMTMPAPAPRFSATPAPAPKLASVPLD